MKSFKKKTPLSTANWKKEKIENRSVEKAVKKLFAEKRRKILRKENKQWKTHPIE